MRKKFIISFSPKSLAEIDMGWCNKKTTPEAPEFQSLNLAGQGLSRPNSGTKNPANNLMDRAY